MILELTKFIVLSRRKKISVYNNDYSLITRSLQSMIGPIWFWFVPMYCLLVRGTYCDIIGGERRGRTRRKRRKKEEERRKRKKKEDEEDEEEEGEEVVEEKEERRRHTSSGCTGNSEQWAARGDG